MEQCLTVRLAPLPHLAVIEIIPGPTKAYFPVLLGDLYTHGWWEGCTVVFVECYFMYESNVGSTGKANELFIDSSSQPAWVAVCKSKTAKVGTENVSSTPVL